MTTQSIHTPAVNASAARSRGRLEHRWSLAHNMLSGATLGAWVRLLRDSGFAVDPAYAHRAAFITAMSVFNAAWHVVERCCFGAKLASVQVRDDPVFILGHWRSGTTHLHNLLAMDTERFACPNSYEAVNPFSFLSSQWINARLFGRLLPATRPMDNMAMAFALPQEDELALCLLSGCSPYLGLVFPSREAYYNRYLTFGDAPRRDVARWKEAFRLFARKLTLRYGRRLVFKSPAHTARVRLLLELFPNARFVHIHRDPYEVFQSSRRYFDTAAWYAYLQRPNRATVDEQILRRYVELHDAYFRDRSMIGPGRLHEVSFADLEADPVGQMRRLYEALGFEGFASVEPAMAAYVDSQRGYRKNSYPRLSEPLRRRVASAWRRGFEEWGYER